MVFAVIQRAQVMSYLLSSIARADFLAPLKDATVGPRGFPHYAYPAECARAPVLPGVLLLFSDDVLIHVSLAGNLRDALSTKGLRHVLRNWPSSSRRVRESALSCMRA
jgi:hypothetical protein